MSSTVGESPDSAVVPISTEFCRAPVPIGTPQEVAVARTNHRDQVNFGRCSRLDHVLGYNVGCSFAGDQGSFHVA